jgi:hypothetical protein
VELERIPDAERQTEEDLWELFDREHPRLLGILFDTLAQVMAAKASIKLSRRPRLADWGEYAAAVYEVLGWGSEAFLDDWDAVVKAQNQATLDGSPVAQAIIKFMEDLETDEYVGTSSELHRKLEDAADSLGISVVRDKAWPKSARWLWRRIKEVLPLLEAAGIEADRGRDNQSKQIALRKLSKSNGTDGTTAEKPVDIGDAGADTDNYDGTSNGTEAPNGTSNGTSFEDEKPIGKPNNGGGADSADSADRYGTNSEAACNHEVPGGCQLCQRQIERLVHEGMSREMAREEILGEEIAL